MRKRAKRAKPSATTAPATAERKLLVSAQVLGAILDVTARRIRQLAEDGIFPRASRGRFDAVVCGPIYLRRLREQGPSVRDAARERKEIAQARREEVELAAVEGSLMPVEMHERRLRERCEELAGRVKGLNRYVKEIRGAPTDEEADLIADRMEDELLAALRGLADTVPDEPEGPDDGGGRALAA